MNCTNDRFFPLFPFGKVFGLVLVAFALLLVSCQKQVSKEEEALKVVRQPGEFEAMDAVWLIWPPDDHLKGYSNAAVTLSILEQLLPELPVMLTCANPALCEQARLGVEAYFLEKEQPGLLRNLSIEELPSVEFWVRDMGPVFVETDQGGLAIADFSFDSWGYADVRDSLNQIDAAYDRQVAELLGFPLISSDLISEGGNREVNGKGTLMLTETVETGRNPGWTKAEMEQEFGRMLGIQKTIWLKEGLKEDEHSFLGPIELEDGRLAYTVLTTNGHIDEFARFVNDSTILLGMVDPSDLDDPIARENQRRMEENYRILKAATDQDGKPFHLIRMPLPHTQVLSMSPGDAVYDFLETLDYQSGMPFPAGQAIQVIAAASYLNFLITPKVVLGQRYWRPGMDPAIQERDMEAKAILEAVFPDRKVVQLDALAVNLGGGGLHCISMHQPTLPQP